MTYIKKQNLPALHDSRKLSDPDLPDVGERNYTSTILKYSNLALPFPQLDTNAKTIVAAINELYAHPGGSIVIPNPEIGGELLTEGDEPLWTEDGQPILTEQGGGGGGTVVGELNSISIDGDIYTIPSGGGGGGDGKHRTLTEEEYDELSDAEKNNGTIYFIEDMPPVTLRPEDLKSTNATLGQLLFYSKYKLWEPTSSIVNLQNKDILAWNDNTKTWGNRQFTMADVATISYPHTGEAIVYDSVSGTWTNGTVSTVGQLNDLTDVTISSVTSGQVLKYDGTKWVNGDESTGTTVSVTQIQSTGTKIATITVDSVDTDLYSPAQEAIAIDDLTDVSITSPTNDQVLKYSNGEWINGDVGNANIWQGTQAQYDAILVKDPDTVYFITDGQTVACYADEVVYDNTTSGLTADTVQEAIDKLVQSGSGWKDLTGTLAAGQTSIQFHDSSITSSSTVQVFVDSAFYGVVPTSITVITGYVTLGFDAQSSNMPVKVRIS